MTASVPSHQNALRWQHGLRRGRCARSALPGVRGFSDGRPETGKELWRVTALRPRRTTRQPSHSFRVVSAMASGSRSTWLGRTGCSSGLQTWGTLERCSMLRLPTPTGRDDRRTGPKPLGGTVAVRTQATPGASSIWECSVKKELG